MAVLHKSPRALDDPADLPTLAYALLAVLARTPSTGYQIAQQLREPIARFWEAGHGQIYPQLAVLERHRLVRSASEPGPGPRPKKTYSITKRGLLYLRRWVGLPTSRWGGRDDLLLKVYASWTADPAATVRIVREAEAHHADELASYLRMARAQRVRGVEQSSPDEPRFAEYATLRRGIGYERGRLAWCRWLIKRLRSADAGGGRATGPGSRST